MTCFGALTQACMIRAWPHAPAPVVSTALVKSAGGALRGREHELARLGPDPRRLVKELHRVTVLEGYIDLGGAHPGWQRPGHVHLDVMGARLDLSIVRPYWLRS